MLTDPREIEIISKARQKNVRDPKRSRAHFDRIFEHFFRNLEFEDRRFLDLGPGHFDFGVLARERGAEVCAIDNDPAVVELGHFKGFETLECDIEAIEKIDFSRRFDGIFCKFSISAYWFSTKEEQQQLVQSIVARLNPDGWIWIAPWNGPRSDVSRSGDTPLSWQIGSFEAVGSQAWEVSPFASKHFGVHGVVDNNVLFTRGLDFEIDPALFRPMSKEFPGGCDAVWPDYDALGEKTDLRRKGLQNERTQKERSSLRRVWESIMGEKSS